MLQASAPRQTSSNSSRRSTPVIPGVAARYWRGDKPKRSRNAVEKLAALP